VAEEVEDRTSHKEEERKSKIQGALKKEEERNHFKKIESHKKPNRFSLF